MDAISADDGYSSVDLNRCIGCGVCVSKFQANAIELKKKDKNMSHLKTQMQCTKKYYLKELEV